MPDERRITIRCSKELHALLTMLADAENRSLNSEVVTLLDYEGRRRAEAKSIDTSSDALRRRAAELERDAGG